MTSDFDTVDLPDTSDVFQAVRRHFTRSMGRCELISIKSVQNLKLWANFVRARVMLSKSVGPAYDRFVFKPTDETDVRAVCQQGFPLCTCTRAANDACAPEQNVVFKEASYAAGQCSPSAGGVRYMFCARAFSTSPPAHAHDGPQDIANQLGNTYQEMVLAFQQSEQVFSGDSPTGICRYPFQAYPEFLILFKASC